MTDEQRITPQQQQEKEEEEEEEEEEEGEEEGTGWLDMIHWRREVDGYDANYSATRETKQTTTATKFPAIITGYENSLDFIP